MTLLAANAPKAKKPDNWKSSAPAVEKAYGCMLRKDDPSFKALVDETVLPRPRPLAKRRNGLINGSKIIPPKNLNLNFRAV
jgi:glutamate/aspartate transport system substrate-binding protein